MISTPESSSSPSRQPRKDSASKHSRFSTDLRYKLSVPGMVAPSLLPNLSPIRHVAHQNSAPGTKHEKQSHKTKFIKALVKMTMMHRNNNRCDNV